MRAKRSLILYVTSLGADLAILPFFLLMWLFWGTRLHFEKRPGKDPKGKPYPGNWMLVWELKEGNLKGYTYGATTPAPHLIMYREGRNSPVAKGDGWMPLQEHEHTHGEQYEAMSVAGCMVAAWIIPWSLVLALCVYVAAPFVFMGCFNLTAWIRGENIYRGAGTEEAAYAIDDVYERDHT